MSVTKFRVEISVSTPLGVSQIIGKKSPEGEFYIPWPTCTEDLEHFHTVTLGAGKNAVILGDTAWRRVKSLSGRTVVVVSRDPSLGQVVHETLDVALRWCQDARPEFDHIFVIGSAPLSRKCFENIDLIYRTEMAPALMAQAQDQAQVDPSCHLPKMPTNQFSPSPSPSPSPTLRRECQSQSQSQIVNNPEEQAYLTLLREISLTGTKTADRTGVGCRSGFGKVLRFDLSSGRIPLLTTKRVFFRGSVEEMLFFVSGCTDVQKLRGKKVHIWDGNSTREFLDKRGLSHYDEWDMGPTYGFLMRHAGAEGSYVGKDADYSGQGVDQFQRIVDGIKEDPHSRRHLVNLWSPAHLDKMCLPPCLFNYTFYVDAADGSISLMASMRSADIFLGVPFNVCGASLLLRMVCHLTDRQPKELMLIMANCHLYETHVAQAGVQLERQPRGFPLLEFQRSRQDIGDSVHGFCVDDFVLTEYEPHVRPIKAKMAV
jgi:thymidylate synthase